MENENRFAHSKMVESWVHFHKKKSQKKKKKTENDILGVLHTFTIFALREPNPLYSHVPVQLT
jgi:hypothetical protein